MIAARPGKWPLLPLLVAQPLCVAVYQYLAKALGQKLGQGSVMAIASRFAASPLFWGLIAVEVLGLVVWLAILDRLDLARAFPLTAVSYCLVIGIGIFIFHEKVEAATLIGSVLILAGIGLLAGGERHGA
jgi:multidrug transporter EmrE-like cation transporter